jgi:hypothetical protein
MSIPYLVPRPVEMPMNGRCVFPGNLRLGGG